MVLVDRIGMLRFHGPVYGGEVLVSDSDAADADADAVMEARVMLTTTGTVVWLVSVLVTVVVDHVVVGSMVTTTSVEVASEIEAGVATSAPVTASETVGAVLARTWTEDRRKTANMRVSRLKTRGGRIKGAAPVTAGVYRASVADSLYGLVALVLY